MSEESHLRWLCRRGMKELDVVLTRYLDGRYPVAAEPERQDFRRLLEMPDPDLYSLVMQHAKNQDPRIQNLIESIRGFAKAQ